VIRIITGADGELGQWIGERLGMALGAGAGLGFAEEGRLLCAIHYTTRVRCVPSPAGCWHR
jgi:hypothetical protein